MCAPLLCLVVSSSSADIVTVITLYQFVYYPSRHVPSHASKEVLVVMGSLTTCDPGNIFPVIEVSLISLLILQRVGDGRELGMSGWVGGCLLVNAHPRWAVYQSL